MFDVYYGLVITGIGDYDEQRPISFYRGTIPGTVNSGDYSHYPALMSAPDHLRTKIDPIKGSVEVGSMTFELGLGQYYETDNGLISPLVDTTQLLTGRWYEADGLLAANITDSATSITLYSRSGSGFAVNDTVFLEREAILLTALTGSNSGNRTQTFTCIRGFAGTNARAHDTVPGTSEEPSPEAGYDNRVYLNPRLKGRLVKVLEYTYETSDVEVVWHGIIEDMKIIEEGMVVQIEATDLYGLFAQRQLNKLPPGGTQPTDQPFSIYKDRDKPDSEVMTINASWNTSALKYGPGIRPAVTQDVLWQMDETLFPVRVLSATSPARGWYKASSAMAAVSGIWSAPILDTELPEEGRRRQAKAKKSNPVLAFGQDVKSIDGQDLSMAFDETGARSNHRLDAWLNFLTSSSRGDNYSTNNFDVWSVQWGLGMPHELVDVAGIMTVRDTYPDDEVYALVFGWDGKEWTVTQFRDQVLTAGLYYPHFNSSAQLTVSKLAAILPGNTSLWPTTGVTPVDSYHAKEFDMWSEEMDLGLDNIVQSVQTVWGHPWQKKSSLTRVDASQGIELWDPQPPDPDLKFDVTSYPPMDEAARGEAASVAQDYLSWMRSQIPTYMFGITRPSIRPYVGQKVKITFTADENFNADTDHESPWYTKDGVRIAGSDTIYGIVLSVEQDFDNHSYDVEVWAVNEGLVNTPKAIPPTLHINDYNPDSGYIMVQRYDFGGTDLLPFIQDNFTNGYSWEVWSPDGGPQSIFVDAGTYGYLTVGNEIHIYWGTTLSISAGDWLRPVAYDDSGGDGKNWGTVFAYQADSFGELKDQLSATFDGDIYL